MKRLFGLAVLVLVTASVPVQAQLITFTGNNGGKQPVGPWYLYWPLEAYFQVPASPQYPYWGPPMGLPLTPPSPYYRAPGSPYAAPNGGYSPYGGHSPYAGMNAPAPGAGYAPYGGGYNPYGGMNPAAAPRTYPTVMGAPAGPPPAATPPGTPPAVRTGK